MHAHNHHHDHSHGHHHDHGDVKNIRAAFFLNLSFTIIEFVGGLITNSVAILSDAVHVVLRSAALMEEQHRLKLLIRDKLLSLGVQHCTIEFEVAGEECGMEECC